MQTGMLGSFGASLGGLKGGSWMSTGAGASRFARFAFRRHFFQHLGFRMVRSRASVPARLCQAEVFVLGSGVSDNPVTLAGLKDECFHTSTNSQFRYETVPELDSQLQAEFGKMNETGKPLVDYVEKTVAKYASQEARESAVVLGCGAGLTSHLLTKTFDKVVGVDFSGRFINAAMALKAGKEVTYGEGQVASLQTLEGAWPEQVTFKQMTWVPNEVEGCNVVVVEFLERVSEPRGWLVKLWECVLPGGLVVVAASNKWGDRSTLDSIIGKWFSFLEEVKIGSKLVTAWQLK